MSISFSPCYKRGYKRKYMATFSCQREYSKHASRSKMKPTRLPEGVVASATAKQARDHRGNKKKGKKSRENTKPKTNANLLRLGRMSRQKHKYFIDFDLPSALLPRPRRERIRSRSTALHKCHDMRRRGGGDLVKHATTATKIFLDNPTRQKYENSWETEKHSFLERSNRLQEAHRH